MGEYNDEYYYQKYLKYKNKYLELKEYEGGALISPFDSGVIAYFCNSRYLDQICKEIQMKTPSSNRINDILTKDGLISFKGKKDKVELHEVTKNVYNKVTGSAARAASATARGASSLGSATARGASSLGSATARGATSLGSATARGAKSMGSAIIQGYDKTKQKVSKLTTKSREDILVGGASTIKVLKDSETGKELLINTVNDSILTKIIKGLQNKYPHIDSVIIINYTPIGSICLKRFTAPPLPNNPNIQLVNIPNLENVEAIGEEVGGEEARGEEAGGEKARGEEARGANEINVPNQDNGDKFFGIVKQAVANKNRPVSPGKSSPLRRSATARF